jgi:hypothetical protein
VKNKIFNWTHSSQDFCTEVGYIGDASKMHGQLIRCHVGQCMNKIAESSATCLMLMSGKAHQCSGII